MIVGFTITDFKGHESEAIEYISRVCILESSEIAENIVKAGVGVNIFSSAIDLDELEAQPFDADIIETQDSKYLIVSAVNFNLELLYNDEVLKLAPTEYRYVEPFEVEQFLGYREQNLIKIIPDIEIGDSWILNKGSWDDNGIWVDSSSWEDSNE